MEGTAGLEAAVEKNDMLYCGRNLFIAKSQPPKPIGGFGARGRGRGGSDRGRRGGGRGGGRDGGRGRRGGGTEHMHRRLNLDGGGEGGTDGRAAAPPPATSMMPRAVLKAAPKTNDDFRKLLDK